MSFTLPSFKNKKVKEYLPELFIYLFLCFEGFIVIMNCTLNPWLKGRPAEDSSVYKYVALVMQRGGMPYKDTFDHKGPVLYIFNYIGNRLSYWCGIWIIELLLICFFAIMLYKIARLFTEKLVSMVIASVTLFSLWNYYNAGNNPEEYAIGFIALATYIFLDYLKNNKITNLRLVICGLGFGIVLLIKVNFVAVWVVFCLAVLVKSLKEEKRFPTGFLLWFLLGAAAVVLPIVIWLISKGAFGAFIECYWKFNITYSTQGESVSFYDRYSAMMPKIHDAMYLIAFASVIFLIAKKKNLYLNITYMIYLVFVILMIGLSGQNYAYYGMLMIPALVYPPAAVCGYLKEENNQSGAIFVFIICMVLCVFPTVEKAFDSAMYSINASNRVVPMSDEMREFFALIEENTTEDEPIQVIGTYNFIYNYSKRLAASRYSFQIPISQKDPAIYEQFCQDLREKMPKLIILEKPDFEYMFVTMDSYEQIYLLNGTMGLYRLK